MKVSKNKILAEVLEEPQKSAIIVSENKRAYVKARVLSVGEDVKSLETGDTIVVFNVYEAQILEYEGKKLIFVKDEEGYYFKC